MRSAPAGSRRDCSRPKACAACGAQQLRLKRERTIDGALGRPELLLGRKTHQPRDGPLRVGFGEVRVDLDRALQPFERALNIARVQKLTAREVVVVGLEVGVVTGCGARRDVSGHRGSDGGGDLGLDVEDVGELAVVGLGPELSPALVEELRRYAQLAARLAHAALQDVAHTEHRADALDPDGAVLERERGRAADHVQLTDARERVQDLLGDAVAEVAVVGIVADVGEGKHGDGVFEPFGRWGARGDICGCGLRRRVADAADGLVQERERDAGEGGE